MQKKYLLLLATALLAIGQTASAHQYTLTATQAREMGIQGPSLTTTADYIPFSNLLYGELLEVKVEGASFTTTDINRIKAATTISSDNVIRAYRASSNSIKYRISGNREHRVINFVDITIDGSILSSGHDLAVRVPVELDITPPDAPHADANKVAMMSDLSVKDTDFLSGSGKVFTLILNQGEFLPGCADPIAHSIMKTSNVQGLVKIWQKSATQVDFIVEGGNYTPDSGNWNFELEPDATSLNKTLYVSTPILH